MKNFLGGKELTKLEKLYIDSPALQWSRIPFCPKKYGPFQCLCHATMTK